MGTDSQVGEMAQTVCAFSFYIQESSVCMSFKVLQETKHV